MLDWNEPGKTTKQSLTTAAVSACVHAAVLLALLGVWRASRNIAPFRLPGTSQGTRLLTYYAAGSPPHAVSDLPSAEKPKPVETTRSHMALKTPTPKPPQPAAPATETGTGSSQQSGLGEGDIRIALQTVHPYPKPDLSALPHGTVGDVVLNAVIDEHGRIASLIILRGLGQNIDDTVVATVKQWAFSPATRNGVPIPSEQELHFHYERG